MDIPLRRPWSKEEDDAICALVEELGERQWRSIANKLKSDFKIKGRSGKQCRERWINYLNPSISTTAWTSSDETKLFELHMELGNSWTEIAKRLGHTDNSVKNHFYSSLRRNIRIYNKTHSQQLPSCIDLKDIVSDEYLAKEILKPNYHGKRRTKPWTDKPRRSIRTKKNVNYHMESSDDEEEDTEIKTDSDPPKKYSEKKKPSLIICPSPKNEPVLYWTPSSFLFTPQNVEAFHFPEDSYCSENVLSPNFKFDIKTPMNSNLPAFYPEIYF